MPLVSGDSALSIHLTQRDAKKILWLLGVHVVAAALLLGIKAHASPDLAVACLSAWVCLIVAPAAGVAAWLRSLRRAERPDAVLRRMLVAPLIVGWLALVTLVELMARVHSS